MSQTYFLPPQKLKISRKEGAYFLKMDGQKTRIAPPRRALPLSNPDEFIVLSDEDGQEIGVLRRLDSLEPESRGVLGACLAELYRLTPILKILDVEREPLSGQVRWRVETEAAEIGVAQTGVIETGASHSGTGAETSAISPEKSGAARLLSRAKTDAKLLEEQARHEITFFIAGAEDVQSSRYPQIFLTDTEGNRYEISDCESLDLNSRRISQQYF